MTLPVEQDGERSVHVLPDPAATDHLGRVLAASLGTPPTGVIALYGDLGAGKTHLVRALLRAFGESGPVKSPTYTLVEPYDTPRGRVMHMDLYRLGGDDWWGLGLEDDAPDHCLWCVEWPEHAQGALPPLRLSIHLTHHTGGRLAALCWHDRHDPAVPEFIANMNKVE